MKWVWLQVQKLVTQLTWRHRGQSSALQSLGGWQLTPQQRSWLNSCTHYWQQQGPRVVAERTCANTPDCMRWQALKLTVPAGRGVSCYRVV